MANKSNNADPTDVERTTRVQDAAKSAITSTTSQRRPDSSRSSRSLMETLDAESEARIPVSQDDVKEKTKKPKESISNRHSPRTWDELYEVLVNFQQEHGHTNVPSRDTNDRGLSEFVRQLKNQPKNNLPKDQKQKLDQIGFDWTNGKERQDQSWNTNLKLLKRFHERHGHFRVQKFPVYEKLYSWLCRQRMLQSKGLLREDRKELLEKIGFQKWDLQKRKQPGDKLSPQWMAQYKLLQEYSLAHNHSMVPQHKQTGDSSHKTLSNWVRKQRSLRKNNNLSHKKIALLDKLHFVWSFNSAVAASGVNCGVTMSHQRPEFDRIFDIVKAYKHQHGNLNIPSSHMYQNVNIGRWLRNQRYEARKGRMVEDRMDRLLQLGVVFETAAGGTITWNEEVH